MLVEVVMERSVSCSLNKVQMSMPKPDQARHHHCTGRLTQVILQLLIKYEADLQLCYSDGQTPLHKVPLVNEFNNQNKGHTSIPFIYRVKYKLLKDNFCGHNPQRPDLLYLNKLLLFSELSN